MEGQRDSGMQGHRGTIIEGWKEGEMEGPRDTKMW